MSVRLSMKNFFVPLLFMFAITFTMYSMGNIVIRKAISADYAEIYALEYDAYVNHFARC